MDSPFLSINMVSIGHIPCSGLSHSLVSPCSIPGCELYSIVYSGFIPIVVSKSLVSDGLIPYLQSKPYYFFV